jgi:acetyl/propionyl-CoA carboxylase alpha subunit
MIAKIMSVGRDRMAAIRRMRRALDEVAVSGIQTTLPFDRALVRDPAFIEGAELSTDWVAQRWDGEAARREARDAGARAAAIALTSANATTPHTTSLRKDTNTSQWGRSSREHGIDRWPRQR